MALKIFRNSFITGIIVLLLCLAMFFGVLYEYYENQVFAELGVEAGYVAAGIDCAGEQYLDSLDSRSRITLIDSDGSVVFDSAADTSTMGNHMDRDEIAEAFESGSGQSKHFSKTLLR